MDIRKLSIGPDYKSGAMHYLVGQFVLNNNYKIHLIKWCTKTSNYLIYIIQELLIRIFESLYNL